MSEASLLINSTINQTMETTLHRDKDINIKENNLNNLNSFQITFDPVNHGAFFPNPEVSDRSFGLLGVIGGCVLLLLFLAFITCVRQRRLYKVIYMFYRTTEKCVIT